jgi:hypothetical protein
MIIDTSNSLGLASISRNPGFEPATPVYLKYVVHPERRHEAGAGNPTEATR